MEPAPRDHAEDFARLWVPHQAAVALFLRSLLWRASDADDVLQETALVVLRRLGDYDRGRPFLPWVCGIARLEALSWGRRRQRETGRLLPVDGALAEGLASACGELAAVSDDRLEALRHCRAGLAPRAAEIVRLRYQESVDPVAIAQRLRLSAVAVRVALSRARSALLACMDRRLGQRI